MGLPVQMMPVVERAKELDYSSSRSGNNMGCRVPAGNRCKRMDYRIDCCIEHLSDRTEKRQK